MIIKQDEIKAIQDGGKEMKSELAEAAKKADKLTKALRKKGYEAYQFHDRYASIVTVGSFNSVGTPRADGRTEINPRNSQDHEDVWPRTRTRRAAVQNALKASGIDTTNPRRTGEDRWTASPSTLCRIPVQVPNGRSAA